jgi:ankyrin repeat protein
LSPARRATRPSSASSSTGAPTSCGGTTDGRTPLHIASEQDHEAVVRLLLDRGADVRAALPSGRTPLHIASQEGHAAVVRLLLDRGADVRAALPSGWTPLHIASLEGHEPVVRLLLDRGADVTAAATDGRTPLHTSPARRATRPSSACSSTGART